MAKAFTPIPLMGKNIAIIVLALATATLLFVAFRQARHIRELRSELAPRQPELAPRGPVTPAPEARTRSPAAVGVPPATVAPSPAPAAPAHAPGDTPPAEETAGIFDLAKMLDSPDMKEMIRSQHRLMMDQTYGELFDSLHLEGEDRETFKDLLTDKMMAAMGAGLSAMKTMQEGGSPPADTAQINGLTEAHDERIRAFLGAESFEIYKQYEDTQAERSQVDLFKQSLGATEALTWQQEHELIVAMHEERQGFSFSAPQEASPLDLAGGFSEEMMERHLADLDTLHERYLMRAAQILSPAQVEQYESSLNQMYSMQEMSFRMAGRMFGKEGESTAEQE